jgi:hypothetical protein
MKKIILFLAAALAISIYLSTVTGCQKKEGEAAVSAGKTYTLKMSTQLNETSPMVDGGPARWRATSASLPGPLSASALRTWYSLFRI